MRVRLHPVNRHHHTGSASPPPLADMSRAACGHDRAPTQPQAPQYWHTQPPSQKPRPAKHMHCTQPNPHLLPGAAAWAPLGYWVAGWAVLVVQVGRSWMALRPCTQYTSPHRTRRPSTGRRCATQGQGAAITGPRPNHSTGTPSPPASSPSEAHAPHQLTPSCRSSGLAFRLGVWGCCLGLLPGHRWLALYSWRAQLAGRSWRGAAGGAGSGCWQGAALQHSSGAVG
jgi:hypothetical protein